MLEEVVFHDGLPDELLGPEVLLDPGPGLGDGLGLVRIHGLAGDTLLLGHRLKKKQVKPSTSPNRK